MGVPVDLEIEPEFTPYAVAEIEIANAIDELVSEGLVDVAGLEAPAAPDLAEIGPDPVDQLFSQEVGPDPMAGGDAVSRYCSRMLFKNSRVRGREGWEKITSGASSSTIVP